MTARDVMVLSEVADDVAYVVAVLLMRRDPAWITQRLENRG